MAVPWTPGGIMMVVRAGVKKDRRRMRRLVSGDRYILRDSVRA